MLTSAGWRSGSARNKCFVSVETACLEWQNCAMGAMVWKMVASVSWMALWGLALCESRQAKKWSPNGSSGAPQVHGCVRSSAGIHGVRSLRCRAKRYSLFGSRLEGCWHDRLCRARLVRGDWMDSAFACVAGSACWRAVVRLCLVA